MLSSSFSRLSLIGYSTPTSPGPGRPSPRPAGPTDFLRVRVYSSPRPGSLPPGAGQGLLSPTRRRHERRRGPHQSSPTRRGRAASRAGPACLPAVLRAASTSQYPTSTALLPPCLAARLPRSPLLPFLSDTRLHPQAKSRNRAAASSHPP